MTIIRRQQRTNPRKDNVDRKLNVLFVFLLVVVGVTAANPVEQWQVILGGLLATAFSFAAFLFQRLSLDGMFAAIVIGSYIFGFGGWPAAAIVLLFFVSSAALSSKWKDQLINFPNKGRRRGLQVWANGFWLVISFSLLPVFESPIFIIAALGTLATATADTWGTEIGTQKGVTTYLITDFQKVPPGTDGGLSLRGTTAALFGSAMIGLASVYIFSYQFDIFICIFASGFLGSAFDSYFGATFQRNNRSVTLPILQQQIPIDNNMVNVISTGVGALLAIIFKLIII